MTDPNHDIVPTLRLFDGVMTGKAADEIERLRAEVKRLRGSHVSALPKEQMKEYCDQRKNWEAAQQPDAGEPVAHRLLHKSANGAWEIIAPGWVDGQPSPGLLTEVSYDSENLRLELAQAPVPPPQVAQGDERAELQRLRQALVYVAFALHDTPQHMLAQGIALIDGNRVQVKLDGWTVDTGDVTLSNQPSAGDANAEELRQIGFEMSNIAYNWAQEPGKLLSKRECKILRDLADRWDRAALATKETK